MAVGVMIDWFGFSTTYVGKLEVINSDSGDNKKRVCVTNATVIGSVQSNAGRYSSGVDHTGGVWRNPSVKYRVIGDLTFACNLGKSFEATGLTISGYMITSVEVNTAIGEFPTITVSANANEGVDAINLFGISIPIQATAHAQRLMSSSSGGGELQKCTLRASADPVVCEENLMPCASDVVRGKFTVTSETIAANEESAPTASNGFVEVGTPIIGSDGEIPTYAATFVKEIV